MSSTLATVVSGSVGDKVSPTPTALPLVDSLDRNFSFKVDIICNSTVSLGSWAPGGYSLSLLNSETDAQAALVQPLLSIGTKRPRSQSFPPDAHCFKRTKQFPAHSRIDPGPLDLLTRVNANNHPSPLLCHAVACERTCMDIMDEPIKLESTLTPSATNSAELLPFSGGASLPIPTDSTTSLAVVYEQIDDSGEEEPTDSLLLEAYRFAADLTLVGGCFLAFDGPDNNNSASLPHSTSGSALLPSIYSAVSASLIRTCQLLAWDGGDVGATPLEATEESPPPPPTLSKDESPPFVNEESVTNWRPSSTPLPTTTPLVSPYSPQIELRGGMEQYSPTQAPNSSRGLRGPTSSLPRVSPTSYPIVNKGT